MDSFLAGFADDRRDLRTKDWPLMETVWPTALISVAYLGFALKIGPNYMANRKPMELTTAMNLYNIVQIVGNVWLLYNYIVNGWGTYYSWGTYKCLYKEFNVDCIYMQFFRSLSAGGSRHET